MKILILGGGDMACGVAHYLANDDRVKSFWAIDNNMTNLLLCKKYIGGKGRLELFNISSAETLAGYMKPFDIVINTLPFSLYGITTKAAVLAGKLIIDLGGNDEVVYQQRRWHMKARDNNAAIIYGCGMAPGLISDIAYFLASQLDRVFFLKMYCGGLPQLPSGKLRHMLTFNAEGLYNEYREFPKIILTGVQRTLRQTLPEGDLVKFDGFGTFESALTHGAWETDTHIWNNVNNMSYATLRFDGHFKTIREYLDKLDKKEVIGLLKKELAPFGKDMMLARVTAKGVLDGKDTTLTFDLVDKYDEKTGLSAMARCTGFSAAETALQVIERGDLNGTLHHEEVVNLPKMIKNLSEHGIAMSISYE